MCEDPRCPYCLSPNFTSFMVKYYRCVPVEDGGCYRVFVNPYCMPTAKLADQLSSAVEAVALEE